MFNGMNIDEILSLSAPNLKGKLSGINVSDNNTINKIIKNQKNGNAFSIFPEYNPNGLGIHYKKIPFFGKNISVLTGPYHLSKITNSPLITVIMTSNNDGTFTLKFCDYIEACNNYKEIERATEQVWNTIENELSNNNYGEWEIWYDFDKID